MISSKRIFSKQLKLIQKVQTVTIYERFPEPQTVMIKREKILKTVYPKTSSIGSVSPSVLYHKAG